MERRTTLYETHVKYGGKIVPFAGYLLPVQYETGVIREHMAVRTACGLFDVSHMGEILCRGEDALKNLNHLLTNDFAGMVPGQARYSPMCNESGGVVDDLIAYKVAEDVYLLVVNAANKEKDFQWMKDHRTGGAEFTDLSDLVGQIALQGPKAETILRKLRKISRRKITPAHSVAWWAAGMVWNASFPGPVIPERTDSSSIWQRRRRRNSGSS